MRSHPLASLAFAALLCCSPERIIERPANLTVPLSSGPTEYQRPPWTIDAYSPDLERTTKSQIQADRQVLAARSTEILEVVDKDLYLTSLESGRRTRITVDASSLRSAAFTDSLVVWCTTDAVKAYDRTTETTFFVSDKALRPSRVTMSRRWVVWEDRRNEPGETYWKDLYGYDLTTRTEIPVAVARGTQAHPSIWEDVVVWDDNRTSNALGTSKEGGENLPENTSDIYLRNLRTGDAVIVARNEWRKSHPTISDSLVAWSEYRDQRTADIFLRKIGSPEILQVTRTPHSETYPILAENHLIWHIRTAFDVILRGPHGDRLRKVVGIYALNLDTHELKKVTDYKEPRVISVSDGRLFHREGGWGPIRYYITNLME